MKRISKSLKDTGNIAKEIVAKLSDDSSKGKALILGLYGNLGAGKTVFTQELARELGIKEKVVSPTFVIMKRFGIPKNKFKNLIHIDAYRLEKGAELEKLGWADIISDPENLVLIEWPEQVHDVMPKEHMKIHIKHLDESSREFELPML
jgi:tRNA threonylcarbamoyladenosine biosynthesis protein TsaE